MTLLLSSTSRSVTRARGGSAALAVRSPAAIPWTGMRSSSNVSADDIIKQVVGDSHHGPQSRTDPTTSIEIEKISRPNPGPEPPAETRSQEASNELARRASLVNRAERKSPLSPASKSEHLAHRKLVAEGLARRTSSAEPSAGRVSLAEPLVRRCPMDLVPSPERPLFQKYYIKQMASEAVKDPGPVHRPLESPEAVLSRPRVVFLRRLPPKTQPKDIILAIEQAVEVGQLSHRADRITEVRIIPRFGNANSLGAMVEFLHPDGARVIQNLVEKGKLQVRGAVPVASFHESTTAHKLSGDAAIGARSQGQERREYFASPEKRKIVRRTPLIYN